MEKIKVFAYELTSYNVAKHASDESWAAAYGGDYFTTPEDALQGAINNIEYQAANGGQVIEDNSYLTGKKVLVDIWGSEYILGVELPVKIIEMYLFTPEKSEK